MFAFARNCWCLLSAVCCSFYFYVLLQDCLFHLNPYAQRFPGNQIEGQEIEQCRISLFADWMCMRGFKSTPGTVSPTPKCKDCESRQRDRARAWLSYS